MKFEQIGNDDIINLEHLTQVKRITYPDSISKTYDEKTQTVKTEVKGEPFAIQFKLTGGNALELRYREEARRDDKFVSLVRGLGANQ